MSKQPASPLYGARRFSSSQTPKTPSSPTIEQLLHGDATRWSPSSPALGRDHHDPEEDHTHLHKKSVLAKVKEKAKRWRQNLGKKKQSQDSNTTPSWGVSLDDDHDDVDPEYLGAPMYESEKAPEGLKETARQHPRAVPVTSQKYAVPSRASEDTKCQEKENPPNSPKQKANEENKESVTSPSPSPSKTLTESVTAKLAPAYESVTEKLAPAYATLSEKTHNIAAKIQSLTVSTTSHEQQGSPDHEDQQKYDKGVSVKEYLYQKFEPGEDEKALSKVIAEAISPKKSPDGKGVVEKVRDVVSSLLRTEEVAPSMSIANPASSKLTPTPFTNTTSAPSSKIIKSSSTNTNSAFSTTSTSAPKATNSTANYRASSYVHEAVEEESHGRILQAN
ncbi:unnamed protein product [Rhodiola kirilowii]